MNLQNRRGILSKLKDYLEVAGPGWTAACQKEWQQNAWHTQSFIQLAVKNIGAGFLQEDKLLQWTEYYHLDDNIQPVTVGLVMAGNIPLVGFHDFLSVFISGHRQVIKLSSKDDVLLPHLVEKMIEWNAEVSEFIQFSEMLKGCDAYIATGSNNSSRYFEQYFAKFPHIIRRNRTAVAILDGNETREQLEDLSDDIHLYFGMGCRNVSKIFVPEGYDFVPLLKTFDRYRHFMDHHKYKNNFDYCLSIMLMNNLFYMTNGSTLLIENESLFSPVSQVNYSFYKDLELLGKQLASNPDIQCMVGRGHIPPGASQQPGLFDYADGVDTMAFLLSL